ncbi:MAG: phage major capsid protein [Saccharothrix sp.]|nr:phage major capsid protein [Saccharothrix sp.]
MTSTIQVTRDELRKQLQTKSAEAARFTANGIKDEDGKGLVVSSEDARAFRKIVADMREIKGLLGDLGEYEAVESYLNDPGAPSIGQQQVPAALRPAQFKTLGERFTESKEFKGRATNGIMAEAFVVDGEDLTTQLERKDIYTAAGGTLTRFGFGRVEQEPIVQRPYRTDRVRDLFPVANTNANLIEYMRVLGYLDNANNARPVPERDGDGPTANFGLKPHTSLRLAPAQAPVRTIAHYELAHRNTLDDEPQLRSIIDVELLYGLRLVEDDQLLNGDGAGENLLGILNTPGIQRYPGPGLGWGSADTPVQPKDTYVDAVRRAATRVMLAFYSPTGVVVHPFDWERMETTKDANGNYVVALNVAVGAEKRIWQMPVVASPAMNQGTALTGAFGLGAKIYDRQQSNIRVAEQHADLFIRNAVAILAEQRIGLTVSRPESFVMIDLEEAWDDTPAA